MFNCGIELIFDELKTKIENDCVEAVQHYGFNIDKDQLLRALKESKSFYDEGYADAKKEFSFVHIIIKHPLLGDCDGWLDRERMLIFLDPITCECCIQNGISWEVDHDSERT